VQLEPTTATILGSSSSLNESCTDIKHAMK